MHDIDERERMNIQNAVRSERDRCALIAENWIEAYGATNPQHISPQTWACDAVRDIAEAIRQPSIKD